MLLVHAFLTIAGLVTVGHAATSAPATNSKPATNGKAATKQAPAASNPVHAGLAASGNNLVCETGQYLVSTANNVYDRFSASNNYEVGGLPIYTANVIACLDYCDSLTRSNACLGIVWYKSGLSSRENCFPKNSTISTSDLRQTVSAISVLLNSTAKACPGQGTQMISGLGKSCETGSFVLSSAGAVYSNYSTALDLGPLSGSGVAKDSMQACLDSCDSMNATQCLGATWVSYDQVGKKTGLCYLKSTLMPSSPLPSTLVAYSAIRSSDTGKCAGKGTDSSSDTLRTCETGSYVTAYSGTVYSQFSTNITYSAGPSPVSATTFKACLDVCESLTGCMGVSWIYDGAGVTVPQCYPKTSLTPSPSPPTQSVTGYSAVRNTSSVICPGLGTDSSALTTRSCIRGRYLIATDGAVYADMPVPDGMDYASGATGVSYPGTYQGCVDACEKAGPSKCAFVNWRQFGVLGQPCYTYSSIPGTKAAAFPTTQWAATRSDQYLCNYGTDRSLNVANSTLTTYSSAISISLGGLPVKPFGQYPYLLNVNAAAGFGSWDYLMWGAIDQANSQSKFALRNSDGALASPPGLALLNGSSTATWQIMATNFQSTRAGNTQVMQQTAANAVSTYADVPVWTVALTGNSLTMSVRDKSGTVLYLNVCPNSDKPYAYLSQTKVAGCYVPSMTVGARGVSTPWS